MPRRDSGREGGRSTRRGWRSRDVSDWKRGSRPGCELEGREKRSVFFLRVLTSTERSLSSQNIRNTQRLR